MMPQARRLDAAGFRQRRHHPSITERFPMRTSSIVTLVLFAVFLLIMLAWLASKRR